jgi:hypothetical protein
MILLDTLIQMQARKPSTPARDGQGVSFPYPFPFLSYLSLSAFIIADTFLLPLHPPHPC